MALLAVVGLVVVAAGVGWFFGSHIQSPAEAAAEAEPPPASNITVEVVRKELSADVITRGDVVYDEPVEVELSGSFAEQPERLVVTQAVQERRELVEGDVAVEVVGRPVFLLVGEIPMYRDLRPGASGDDVRQLEEALARMKLFEGTPDDTWDEGTGIAVAAWYESAGYRANGLSDQDEEALRAARERVRSAQLAMADAEAALDEAQEGASKSAIISAEGELEAAQDALALAKADAQWANEDAAAEVEEAASALESAEQDLEEAQDADPPTPPDGLAELQQAVTDAQDALDAAHRNAERVQVEQEALVAQAENRVEVAEASLAELRDDPDTSAIMRQVEAARAELSGARDDLAGLESELGTWLPAGEVVFLDRLPVRVDEVSNTRGSEITGPFITVTGSLVTVRSAVSETDAALLEEGMSVEIENPEGETFIAGSIAMVAEDAGTNGVAPDRVYVEIAPEEVPDDLIGENVRIVIPVSSTGGEVLAVPAAALYATADGSTHVEIEDEDGSLRSVAVETGLAAEGLVEITPENGEIFEGDLAVIGRADGSGPGGEEAEGEAASDG